MSAIQEIHDKIISEKYKTMTYKEIGSMIDRGVSYISGRMKKMGLSIPKEITQQRRSASLSKRRDSDPNDDFIRENYLSIPVKRMASMLNRSSCYVQGRMKRMGLQVPKEIIEKRIKESRIQPGTIPPNKGKVMSDELRKKCSVSWFKKGDIPKNTKYDGHASVRKDKRGIPYRFIRISRGRYVEEHKLIWEAENGKAPKGSVIYHLDGDSLNNDISNLSVRTRADHLEANSGRRELTDSYVLSKLSPRNKDLRPALLQHPELIKLKRNQLKLKRQCRTTK